MNQIALDEQIKLQDPIPTWESLNEVGLLTSELHISPASEGEIEERTSFDGETSEEIYYREGCRITKKQRKGQNEVLILKETPLF